MQLTLLKAKLHHARITHTELEYQGSCAIDSDLLAAAGILVNEQIDIYNMNNGERLTTYAIPAPAGSGIISLNGASALKGAPQDRVIICSYAGMPETQAQSFQPKVVYLDENNRITQPAIAPHNRDTEICHA